MERRLAAILASDVVGYSRLIRADEEGTLAALKGLRADLIDPTLAEHNGRIVKLMGDGMLAEYRFCASIESAEVDRNAQLGVNRVKWFLAGIFAVPGLVLTYCLAVGIAG